MNRRDLLGGVLAVLALPGDAFAQAERVRKIGWLELNASTGNLGIFQHALAARGWVKGTTYALEYRSGEGRIARLAAVTAELVRVPVDILVAPGSAETLAARDATKSIPIVMAGVDDPVAQKLVVSLARPGRNVTGVAGARRELVAKLFSLVRELGPGTTRIAVLLDPTDPATGALLVDMRSAAKAIGLTLNAVEVAGYMDVEPAIVAIKRQGSKFLVVPPSAMLVPRWIGDLALTQGLACVSTSSAYVTEGGLLACTDDATAVFTGVANFVDRILNGTKPADLPVELPPKSRLVVNRKTARALKLTLPPSILQGADAIID